MILSSTPTAITLRTSSKTVPGFSRLLLSLTQMLSWVRLDSSNSVYRNKEFLRKLVTTYIPNIVLVIYENGIGMYANAYLHKGSFSEEWKSIFRYRNKFIWRSVCIVYVCLYVCMYVCTCTYACIHSLCMYKCMYAFK